ncbi:MAG: 3-isopropylmalate dehydratase small subunit, partial [Acidimicrobiia bacterium]|nr:3-isopropylmalate dehydratase small subunit [Acidimicrobiia bacterium]
HMLVNGLDEIGLTLRHAAAIDEFEATRPSFLPAV